MNNMDKTKAGFKELADSTAEDWQHIMHCMQPFAGNLSGRVLAHLQLLSGDYGGFPIDRLQHCLQTATLAYRDRRDEEYVVMSLLHDIGDTLGTYNHPDVAAAILQPFLSEENHWVVQHHGIFQGYYYFHYLGLDRDMREQYRGDPHFAATADFAERYDQRAFDPDYDTAPLDFFAPMVQRLFASPKYALITRP
ncbi:HD domain-containing protein [Rhizorhapis sp. SPR117]|uniref:HD domain-containing protein n=1 Tax=Rhizorhapis sp. SPR117 TaxID=2912611 RepID=UPI001F2095BA|nr:HD domain-containing protein [Rhizorhapis sp. SPR117]